MRKKIWSFVGIAVVAVLAVFWTHDMKKGPNGPRSGNASYDKEWWKAYREKRQMTPDEESNAWAKGVSK